MPGNFQITEMRRIVEYAGQNDCNTIDLWKAKYLFERYERAEKSPCADSELEALIESLSLIADGSASRLKLFYYSFLVRITENPVYLEKMLGMCVDGEINSPFEINFIRWRCTILSFKKGKLSSSKTAYLLRLAYRKCFEGFYGIFKSSLHFIPKNKRKSSLVYVITSQYLDLSHGPTKTLLARCRALKNALGMEVRIINTREHLSSVGRMPYYRLTEGCAVEDYAGISEVEFEGDKFNYYQCPVDMPDIDEIYKILSLISIKRPYFIVNIGGGSITSDLLSKMVPVITVGTVPSALPITEAQFMTIGRKISANDLNVLKSFGIERERVIEGVFTSDFKKQESKFTKEELNLPDGKLIIMVVGWRLDDEVDENFLRMMAKTFSKDVCYTFIGNASGIKKICESDDALMSNSVFLGAQKDMLAIAEVCDLYVNPDRTGGGTSCVEAMSKGVPVVTLPRGDVGLNAGSDFFASDYDDMAKKIERYAKDKQFYNEQSQRAIKRANELTDTNSAFKTIIDKMLKSKYFDTVLHI